jgi:hypothetical protein
VAVLRVLLGVAIVAAALTVWSGGVETRRAEAAGDCWSLPLELDPEEVAFYLLLNEYRASRGLHPLGISTNLVRAASWQAYDMGTQNYFSHTNLAGQDHQQRANACGYAYPSGENLAAGTNWTSGRAAFEAWKASPGHDANMVAGMYVQVGIARYYAPGSKYGWYWATSFGTASDGTDGSDLRIAESGIRAAGLNTRSWNVASVLPGGLRVRDIVGYTAWEEQPNGYWQQWGPNEFIPGGSKVGLLPLGMSMDKGRTPR